MQAAVGTSICRHRPLRTADENSSTRPIGPGRSRRLFTATRLCHPGGRPEHDRGLSTLVGPARSEPPGAGSLPGGVAHGESGSTSQIRGVGGESSESALPPSRFPDASLRPRMRGEQCCVARAARRRGLSGARLARSRARPAGAQPLREARVRLEGFEPPTRGLEGRRSSSELQAPEEHRVARRRAGPSV